MDEIKLSLQDDAKLFKAFPKSESRLSQYGTSSMPSALKGWKTTSQTLPTEADPTETIQLTSKSGTGRIDVWRHDSEQSKTGGDYDQSKQLATNWLNSYTQILGTSSPATELKNQWFYGSDSAELEFYTVEAIFQSPQGQAVHLRVAGRSLGGMSMAFSLQDTQETWSEDVWEQAKDFFRIRGTFDPLSATAQPADDMTEDDFEAFLDESLK